MIITVREPRLIEYSLEAGEAVLKHRAKEDRKELGQFFTPSQVARYMARQLGAISDKARILDPALGSGTLACAVIEYALLMPELSEIWIDGYETDAELLDTARGSLQHAVDYAASNGVKVHVHLQEADFVQEKLPARRDAHLYHGTLLGPEKPRSYDLIIANPPYFKLKSTDPRVEALRGYGHGHTNIYTVFMSLCSRMLTSNGRACFIVPRSFCSGAYFSAFRREFFNSVVIESLHLFESREDTFKEDEILQENVIVTFRARDAAEDPEYTPSSVEISTSRNRTDLLTQPASRIVDLKVFLGQDRRTLFFRLPITELDEHILQTVDGWDSSLRQYGLAVSTGPVVPFRAKNLLMDDVDGVDRGAAVPLLWMNNISRQRITWPIKNGKPQAIDAAAKDAKLLTPTSNYVLLRRFSAKEESRRLIAAPFLGSDYIALGVNVGLENHLNYVYRPGGDLDNSEAVGLSALFNSALIDRYIRITNGNTQVNAAELRAMPLPPLEVIKSIGLMAIEGGDQSDIDLIVFSVLERSGYLPDDIPLFRETRFIMGKIQEAQQALQDLGLPSAQQNEMSALTLLVLAQLSEETNWTDASPKSVRIHDILIDIATRYGRTYAENTRETIRRQVIHQFEQAGLVLRNPDEPGLATNSPRTHYILSGLALETLRHFGTDGWANAVVSFREQKGALFDVYRRQREQHQIPLRLVSGAEYHLSPGKHNELQVAIIEKFGPRFAPGAQVLHVGDTANKIVILDETTFQSLGVALDSHDKLPDVVLFDANRNWLFLVEAVTSHGPVSPKRYTELETMFAPCSAVRVYVSAFPDFSTFRSYLTEIAWETEVWLAEIPDHMIHYNGDKFLGPAAHE